MPTTVGTENSTGDLVKNLLTLETVQFKVVLRRGTLVSVIDRICRAALCGSFFNTRASMNVRKRCLDKLFRQWMI